MPDTRNVFVLGLDDFHRRRLESLDLEQECTFHRLLPDRVLRPHGGRHDIGRLIADGQRELDAFDGSVDAVLSYRDFPESTVQPLLAAHAGAPAASLAAVLRCEHKVWSRREQQRVLPDHTPRFAGFDPFAEDPWADIGLDFPFWLKPVKSYASYLGFRVDGDNDLARAVRETRRHVRELTDPLQAILDRADVDAGSTPPCLVEQIVSGRQCTVEGCRHGGETVIRGIVDSLRYPGRSSFARYQYPSRLPGPIRARLRDLTDRLLAHIGYDDAMFNVEFFWDEATDRIWILEINPRIALRHADLYAYVDGDSSWAMLVQTGLGRRPAFRRGAGPYPMAATVFWREFADARVVALPSAARIREIEECHDAQVEILARAGLPLSRVGKQDAYSFEVAAIYLGGRDEDDLTSRYEQIRDELGIRLAR